MKTAFIYFAIISNLLILASCSNRHYAFVQPTKPVHYYSAPAVGTQPNTVEIEPSIAPPELTASVASDLPQVAITAATAPAIAPREVPVVSNVQVANSSVTGLRPVLSRREVRQQLRSNAREVRDARRPTDGSGNTNGLAIAALVFGIVSLLILPILFGPLAVIFGAIGMSQTKQRGERGYGMAVAGLVMGIIATVIVLIALAR